MDQSQHGGNATPDPWSGWGAQSHPNSPSGGGGPGRFKLPGPLGGGNGPTGWHGTPHPLAPAARYLAVADAYCDRGQFAQARVVEEEGVFYVSLPARAEMRPFLRTQNERFENTVKKMAARSQLAVIVNGNMYKDGAQNTLLRKVGGLLGVNLSTQNADLTTPEGKVRGRGRELGGSSEEEMFYLAWSEGTGGYSFGKGNPPNDSESALGGLGPLIINGLRYGATNQYRRNVPAGAPSHGEPGPAFKAFLEVRSNRTYESVAGLPPGSGKVAIGFGGGQLPLKIAVQPHGSHGVSMDRIRDKFFADHVENAVFLDGSDSAMLFANGRFFVHSGTYKDRTNTIGVGFRLPFCPTDAGGRSIGTLA